MDSPRPPEVRTSASASRSRARRWAKRLLVVALVLFLGSAGLAIGFRRQLAEEMRGWLDAELARSGIHAQYAVGQVRPWGELDLTDLIIHANPGLDSPVFGVSRLKITFNLLGLLIFGESAAAHLSAGAADLTVWHGEESHRASGVVLRARADARGLSLSRLMVPYRDLVLDAKGELLWQSMEPVETADPEKKGTKRVAEDFTLGSWVKWLSSIPDTPDGELSLGVEFAFTGASSDPGTMEIVAKGPRVNWRNLTLEDVDVRLATLLPRDGTSPGITFSPVSFGLGEGHFTAAGVWLAEEGQVDLEHLESSIDPELLLAGLGEKMPPGFPALPPFLVRATGVLVPAELAASDLQGEVEFQGLLEIPLGEGEALALGDVRTPFVWGGREIRLPEFRASLSSVDRIYQVSGALSLGLDKEGEWYHLGFRQATLSAGDELLSGDGDLDLPTGELTLHRLECSADIRSLFRAMGWADPMPEGLSWSEPPRITLRGILPLKSPMEGNLDGSLTSAGTLAVATGPGHPSVELRGLSVPNFSWRKRTLLVPALVAEAGPLDHPVSLSAVLEAAYPEDAPGSLRVREFTVARDSGIASLTGELPLPVSGMRVSRFVSDLDLMVLAGELGFLENGAPVAFPTAPRMVLAGWLDFSDPMAKSELGGTLELPQGFTWSLPEARVWRVSSLETGFVLEEGLLSLPELSARTFEGDLVLNGVVRPGHDPLPIGVSLRLTDANLEEISATLGLEDGRTGRLDAIFTGQGTPSLTEMEGNGSFHIDGAKFVTLPLFRDLRPLLSVVTPTSWKADARSAVNASFTLGRGLFQSEDIRMESGLVTIDSTALIDLNESTVKASGAVAGAGVARVFTELAGKVLQVEGEGSFGAIRWKLKNAPGINGVDDLVGLPADLVRATLGRAAAPGDTLRGATGVARDALEGASEGALDAIGGAAGLGRRLLRFPQGRDAEGGATRRRPPPPAEPVPPETQPRDSGPPAGETGP